MAAVKSIGRIDVASLRINHCGQAPYCIVVIQVAMQV